MTNVTRQDLPQLLDESVASARRDHGGTLANYIPQLASVDPELTSVALRTVDGQLYSAGDAANHRFTLQSSAKVVLLAGLLQELGPDRVFERVGAEPSGDSFASIARLDAEDAVPSNPLINAGAIALCGLIQGTLESRVEWVETWGNRLCGPAVRVNPRVFASERRTGHRNRAIAHILRSKGILNDDIEDVLHTYFALCSLEATVADAAMLPATLAAGGQLEGEERVLSPAVVTQVVSIMATCGMYDESGEYLMRTGMPAKSGVSGTIVAVAVGQAGIAVCSPRVNNRGGSVRGHIILQSIAEAAGWHFAVAGSARTGEG